MNAFLRLQEHIIQISDDETIFAWQAKSKYFSAYRGLLAEAPNEFEESGSIIRTEQRAVRQEYHMSNKGLRISFSSIIKMMSGEYLAIIAKRGHTDIGILIRPTSFPELTHYARVRPDYLIKQDMPRPTFLPRTEPMYFHSTISLRKEHRLERLRCIRLGAGIVSTHPTHPPTIRQW